MKYYRDTVDLFLFVIQCQKQMFENEYYIREKRKLLEKLLKLSPYLINQLDEKGNDPLLYIRLKVHGCRH
ncbi:unnamed protein product [Rotaria sp. Silwood2]|nr:unnamed protein product [Rotaria sp. Silwood2]